MTRIPPFLSKAAAIGLAVLGALLVYGVLISPVTRRLAALDEEIQDQRLMLGRLSDQLETTHADTESEAAAIKSLNFVILAGHNEQIKAASLQARVTKAADDVGIRLASLAVIPSRSEDGVRVVGVDVQFQTDLHRLRELLVGLESKHPTVIVEALRISQTPGPDVRSGRKLDVRISALGIVSKTDEDAQ